MLKSLKVLSALIVAVSLLVSCGKKADTQTPAADSTAVKTLKVAMVTDVGGINDQSFNQSAWEGLQKAQTELKVTASYMESKQDADYAPNFETLVDSQNDLIWGIGFKLQERTLEAAKANPTNKFAIIDFAFDSVPANVACVLFKEQEASFLVGYIAGKMTKTGKVGFVGGMNVPVINRFQYGFAAGVKMANPKAQVMEQFAESFSDAAKGKAIANQMYKKGADIVFHAAGGVGDGVIEAAKEQKKFAIGVDRDQNSLAPDNVITSAMKRVDNAIYSVTKDLVDGKFPAGTTTVYGLKEGGVDIAPTSSKHVPAEILTEVDGIKSRIIAGEVTPPGTKDEFTAWEAANKAAAAK